MLLIIIKAVGVSGQLPTYIAYMQYFVYSVQGVERFVHGMRAFPFSLNSSFGKFSTFRPTLFLFFPWILLFTAPYIIWAHKIIYCVLKLKSSVPRAHSAYASSAENARKHHSYGLDTAVMVVAICCSRNCVVKSCGFWQLNRALKLQPKNNAADRWCSRWCRSSLFASRGQMRWMVLGGIVFATVTTDRLVYIFIFFCHFCDWIG